MNRAKLILPLLLLVLATRPLAAQGPADSTYRFRFLVGKDMFYVPWKDNGRELDRLLAAIDENRSAIRDGRMYLLVESYGMTGNGKMPADSIAHICRNRVKSELILRGRVKEEHFVTDKVFSEPYGGQRNVVIVTLPASVEKVAKIAGTEAAARVEAYNKEKSGEAERERLAAEEKARAEQVARELAEQTRITAEQQAARERAESERAAAEQAERERSAEEEQARQQAESAAHAKPYAFALRTNLLRWATLTPDLGIEWRISRHVGILVNGSWTSWTWNGNDRRYALWEVSPEVRYYIGREKRGYIGAMYKTGSFNYKLSETGRQGDLMGGGITGGYQLKLNKALSLDFNLGIGCVRADYEKYTVIDGVRVRDGKETKNCWGPVSAGVTLMWNIF